ncbi:Protein N-acetyltransferase, RimJ/RimL family [Austwickia chelonae]|uniref:N-acetyltransferase domain-containing protein n=1 Tax=Austwickia chelonae NBRC 105200 TaxID=1184607 RepID=K6V567_9MICO|nr:GNAT family N-acetyltransferase [Austwickia chelonae]GAB77353.1 hypothetical protein AUCHE_05_02620 [Austwickia chelonae NBRC 105200]SEW08480.1 Protein N-acetyltransferase, RimJ/RimL family [Austwickia chelonae]
MTVPLPFPRPRDEVQQAGPGFSRSGVRQARPDDAEAVGAVQAALWVKSFADDLPAEALAMCTPAAFTASWRSSLVDPPSDGHRLLVATEGEGIVGLAAFVPGDEPDLDGAELLLLGVAEDRRRRGHASRLLSAVAEAVEQGGDELLVAWIVAGHEELRAHLQGAGFIADGAYRERVVGPGARTVTEVRLVVSLREARAAL